MSSLELCVWTKLASFLEWYFCLPTHRLFCPTRRGVGRQASQMLVSSTLRSFPSLGDNSRWQWRADGNSGEWCPMPVLCIETLSLTSPVLALVSGPWLLAETSVKAVMLPPEALCPDT